MRTGVLSLSFSLLFSACGKSDSETAKDEILQIDRELTELRVRIAQCSRKIDEQAVSRLTHAIYNDFGSALREIMSSYGLSKEALFLYDRALQLHDQKHQLNMNTSSRWSGNSILYGGGILAVASLLCLLGLKLAKSRRKVKKSHPVITVEQILNSISGQEQFSSDRRKAGKSKVEEIFAQFLPQEDGHRSGKIGMGDAIDVNDVEKHPLLSESDRQSESLPQTNFPQDYLNDFTSENLKGLIQDRIGDLNITGLSVEEWALGVVDFIDEVSGIRQGLSDDERDHLKKLVLQLKKELGAMDCDLIDEDEWTPEKQRAISVKKTLSEGALPRIVDKGATGLIIKGKLIRKQEVVLEIAQS